MLKFNRPFLDSDSRAVVENELGILPRLDHSNIIRVLDAGKLDVTIDGSSYELSYIVEPFIQGAKTLTDYVEELAHRGEDVSEALTDSSLRRLTNVLHQWVTALAYVHEEGYVYLDVKPDNVIVDRNGHLLLIDFGSAQRVNLEDKSPVVIQFTRKYADPALRDQETRATSSDRVKSAVQRKLLDCSIDYYALGKSILELLTIISEHHQHDFPQRPLFRSLHFLATRLLNGKNAGRKVLPSQRNYFNREIFGGLQTSDYATIKYKNLSEVKKDLEKEYGTWNPENAVPELKTYPKDTIRVVPKFNTVLTPRLRSLIEHPLVARLKVVSQLGLIALVYPTADHSRYDHILGVYTYVADYIKSLFNDSENCIFRNLVDENDMRAALLAAIIHDLGQYPLAHELEEVSPAIFGHTKISMNLLSDPRKDAEGRTILEIIQDQQYGWGVSLERLKTILGAHTGQLRLTDLGVDDFKADLLIALIDGPIDADKADYISRDSASCRIPYGEQLDIERLLRVLTSVRIPLHLQPGQKHRVTIGVYEKGRASAAAFSLARYLLYASVYWHHTSRIIKAMLQYAVAMILPPEVFNETTRIGKARISEIQQKLLDFIKTMVPPFKETLERLYPSSFEQETKVRLAEKPSGDVLSRLELERGAEERRKTEEWLWYPGIATTDWLMLDWLKTLSSSERGTRGVTLIDAIQRRNLYKRVYTISRTEENRQFVEQLTELSWS
ncbi:MAG: protein kinase, partial [Candidatus Bathyarchaeia archaeon]